MSSQNWSSRKRTFSPPLTRRQMTVPCLMASIHPIPPNPDLERNQKYANPKRTQLIHRPALQRLEPRQDFQAPERSQNHPLPLGRKECSNHSSAQICPARKNPGAVCPFL